jgi:hypothetical protein
MTETDLDISAYTSRAAWETVPDLGRFSLEEAKAQFQKGWNAWKAWVKAGRSWVKRKDPGARELGSSTSVPTQRS